MSWLPAKIQTMRRWVCEVRRRQHQHVPVCLILCRVHLAMDAAAGAEALDIDQHTGATRLQARHQPVQHPLALRMAVADEDLHRSHPWFVAVELGGAGTILSTEQIAAEGATAAAGTVAPAAYAVEGRSVGRRCVVFSSATGARPAPVASICLPRWGY